MDTSLIITSLIIVLAIIIAYFIVAYFFFSSHTRKLYSGINDARQSFTIDSNDIGEVKQGQNYTLSWWMYIDDFNYRYGQEKVIMRRGVEGNSNPIIRLSPDHPTLIVSTKEILDNSNRYTGETTTEKQCVIKNLDLQRWVHCAVIVSSKYMDIF